MIDTRNENCLIMSELSQEMLTYWFDFKKKKFLHNIDTFYYSVKLRNDLTDESTDKNVKKFRNYFHKKQSDLYQAYDNKLSIDFGDLGNLTMLPLTFSGFYNICLEKPEEFHMFIAPRVPRGTGGVSVTCEIIVQIRSYMLWMLGVHEAFARSMEYVNHLVNMFNLDIDYVQENRVDYCWHSNYLRNPEKFFSIENFYKCVSIDIRVLILILRKLVRKII